MSNNNGNPTVYADAEEARTSGTVEPKGHSTQEVSKAPLSRGKKFLLFCAGILIAAVAAYFVRNAFLHEDTDDAQVDGHIMSLSARINGQVEKVNVIEGQVVHAGDVLVVIDTKDYKVATDQALANLADAKATAASSYYNVPITFASAYSGLDSAHTAVQER